MQILKKTRSVCKDCKKITDADIFEEHGKVYMIKKCCSKRVLVEEDADFYKDIMNMNTVKQFTPKLLSFSITERCNMNCPRCYESSKMFEGKDVEIDEIENVIKNFKGKYILISGGEPTVREDLNEIIKLVISYKFKPVLVTNGIKLVDLNYVIKLKKAGLKFVTLSVDALDDDVYEKTNGKKMLDVKMKVLENIKKVGMKVTLSMTLVKGINECQIGKIINFAIKNDDFVKDIRIRSQIPIGRYIESKKYRLSEMVKLLAPLGIEWEDIKAELEMRKHLSNLFRRNYTLPLTCSIHYTLKIKNGCAIPVGKLLRESKLPYVLKFLTIIGKKNVLKFIINLFNVEKTIIDSRGLMYASLKVWWSEDDIDLDEMKKCHMGYSNGKEISPFCFFHALKDVDIEKHDII